MKKLAVFLLLSCISAGFCFYWWSDSSPRPREAFCRLLAGDDHIQLVGLTITGQMKQVEVTDALSAKCLTIAFRSAIHDAFFPGSPYEAFLHMSNGVTVRCSLMIPVQKTFLMVSEPTGGIWLNDPLTYYKVPLPEVMPDGLAHALSQLN